MSITTLFLVAMLNTGVVVWLINYIPLTKRRERKKLFSKKIIVTYYSPKIWVGKQLWAADVTISLILVVSPLLGLSYGGIQTLVLNTFVAAGLSLGVFIVSKFFIPKWEKKHIKEVINLKNQV